MRTAAYRFRNRWEFALRSDKSFLTYTVLGLAGVSLLIAFALPAPTLEEAGTPRTAGAPAAPTASGAQYGYPLYVSQCARCHGLRGAGDGPGKGSPLFGQPPRDLTAGHYRFVSTTNGIASEADLRHVIVRGLPASGMPAFDRLSERQVDSLVAVLERMWTDRPKPGPRLEPGSDAEFRAASAERGRELYQTYCTSCHGQDGRGDGPAAAGLPVRPTNLAAGELKAGTSREELYYRIAAGIPGEGGPLMPAHSFLQPGQIRSIVAYLRRDVLPQAEERSEGTALAAAGESKGARDMAAVHGER